MVANKQGIVPGSVDDLEGLARFAEESSSPVMRVDPKGVTLYANKFAHTIKALVNVKTGEIDPVLVKKAKKIFKTGKEARFDYPVGSIIYSFSIVPVAEFNYVNIYGRDVTEVREATKRAEGLAKFPNENPNPVMRAEGNGKILFCNSASESITGVIDPGPPLRLTNTMSQVAREAMRTAKIQTLNIEEGASTYLFTLTPVKGENYVNIYGRDITAEIEAQQALVAANNQLELRVAERTASVRLLQNIVLAANSAESLQAALQTALHEICIYTHWPVGHAYIVENTDGQNKLIPTGIWHIETDSKYSDLREATERMRFGGTNSLPGQVLARGREVWIENLAQVKNFQRSEFTKKAGLVSGMAFPVSINTQVIGVLEFFAQEITPPNTEVIKTLEHVGAQLGSVAERKVAENAAKKSQEDAELAHSRLTDALEVIGQGFVLYDRDDNIVLFNDRFAARIRDIMRRDPLIGDSFESIMRATADANYIPGNMADKEQWFADILRERKETKTRDSISRQNDGTWFRAEGFETSDGGTVSIFTDVTELKNKEEQLAEMARQSELAHSRLLDGIEALGQGFALFDDEDRFVMFNEQYASMLEFLTGRPKIGDLFEDVMRRSKRTEFDGKTRDKWIEDVIAERKSDEVRSSTNRLPNGTWYKAEGFRTRDGGNVSIFTNITELKEHEAELDTLVNELGVARDAAVDANSAKSQFLANMSHELRTPLNAIIGYSELLIDDATDDDNKDYIPDLNKIQSAGKHLLGLINDILDLSKIEVGKIELFIEEITVSEMLEDVSHTIKPLMEKNNNVLKLNISKKISKINSDLTKLRQNLFNLLSNASKFSKDSTVTLRTYLEKTDGNDLVVFEVKDEGIGMTPEQLEKVFEPFTQADASTSKKFGGTGLGLTITREFTRMLGGDIAASSKANVGTTFTMKILADGELLQLEEEGGEQQVGNRKANADRPLVLIIDDDANVRDLLQRNLDTAGYRTQTAKNGKEGIEMARKLLPDAITLDVIMPRADGWTVLAELKASAETTDIPIIMVTISEDRSLGLSLGASEFLAKPVDRKKLISVLDRFIKDRANACVLLIEDDDDTRKVMRSYLEKEGIDVIEAQNGRVGLAQLAKTKPALILLDLMMPELDGFGFIEEYRKHPKWHDIPVIVVTAKSLTGPEKQKLEGWVEAFYSKIDTNIDQVLEQVAALLPPSSKSG